MSNTIISVRRASENKTDNVAAFKPKVIAGGQNVDKSNNAIKKAITAIIGDVEISPLENVLIDTLEVMAKEHGGDFNKEDMNVLFEGTNGDLYVYGFINQDDDEEELIEYQALFHANDPVRLHVGEPCANFADAIKSIME